MAQALSRVYGRTLFFGTTLAVCTLAGFSTQALAQTPGQVSDPPAATSPGPAPSSDAPGAPTGTAAAPDASVNGASTQGAPAAQDHVPPGHVDPSQHAMPEPGDPHHQVNHPHPPSGQGKKGFVVAAAFGIRPNFAPNQSAGTVSTDMASSLQGGLALGFKYSRVVLTLGLDIGAIDSRDSSSYRTTTTFLIVPGLQVALLRSRDQRVELLGSLRLGAGSTMTTDGSSTSKPPVLVMYEIAPAVRYWAHKQFALQFLAGYGGEYQITSNFGGTTSNGRHSLAASIGTIGLF